MVSGPRAAPPSLGETGKNQSGGSRKASNYRELRPALSICGAKTKARGEGGSRSTPACGAWLGPGKKETVAFDSRTLGAGWRGAGSLHPSEGSYLAPKTWARPPKTLQSFPSRSHPPYLSPAFGGCARALPSLTSSSARKAEAGRSLTQKRTRDRYRPAREWRENASAVSAAALARGCVFCPDFSLFYK